MGIRRGRASADVLVCKRLAEALRRCRHCAAQQQRNLLHELRVERAPTLSQALAVQAIQLAKRLRQLLAGQPVLALQHRHDGRHILLHACHVLRTVLQ